MIPFSHTLGSMVPLTVKCSMLYSSQAYHILVQQLVIHLYYDTFLC